MQGQTATNRSPVAFFVLTFVLSLPLYAFNALAYQKVLFGPEMGAVCVSLLTLTPIAAASILTLRRTDRDGVLKLLRRIVDVRRIERKEWYAPILLVLPFISLLSLGVMISSGEPVPPSMVPVWAVPVAFLFFFILAAGEEVGWMGYAFEPLRSRHSALEAALILGVIWAVWHLPFFVFMMPDRVILLARLLTLVGTRVLMGWIFNNTGESVFATILLHAADNTALVALPGLSAASPVGAVVHCGLVLAAATIVTMLWGPGTLARFRWSTGR